MGRDDHSIDLDLRETQWEDYIRYRPLPLILNCTAVPYLEKEWPCLWEYIHNVGC